MIVNTDRLDRILADIREEFIRATGLHNSHSSLHESYGVLHEETDELWDDVKKNRWPEALSECIQVRAMAVRFIHDEGERCDLRFQKVQEEPADA